MSHKILAFGVPLVAALVFVGPSFAEGTPEAVLAAKGLRRSGEMYIARGEDDVKKAADAADARLKEFRYAVARDQAATREASAKKSMASDLTKQRSALRHQMAQTLPQLRAQIQTLTQQRTAIRQQLNDLRYANGGPAVAAYNQLADSYNALGNQIQALTEANNPLVDTDAEAAERIEQLSAPSDPTKPAMRTSASPEDRLDAYSEALKAWRKVVDAVKTQYAALTDDAEVKAAMETLNKRSAKVRYVLGPSRKFSDTVKALEEAEAKGLPDPDTAPQPRSLTKSKSKTARRKN